MEIKALNEHDVGKQVLVIGYQYLPTWQISDPFEAKLLGLSEDGVLAKVATPGIFYGYSWEEWINVQLIRRIELIQE